jgi:hypothetical protein
VRTFLKEADALKTKLAAIYTESAAGASAQIDSVAGPRPPILGTSEPRTLRGISDRLDELNKAIEGSDGAPSPDSLKGYVLISGMLDEAAARWSTIAAAARAQLPPGK